MESEEIIRRVKCLMNETDPGEPDTVLLADEPLGVEQAIAECIADAANIVFAAAPVHLVPLTDGTPLRITEKDGAGIIQLPGDFVRLASLRLSTWKRTLFSPVSPGSAPHREQNNSYLKAGTVKPVAVLTGSSGGARLECYPFTTGTTVQELFYSAKAAGAEDIPENSLLTPAVCYMCAALAYGIFGNAEAAGLMKATATELIPQQ